MGTQAPVSPGEAWGAPPVSRLGSRCKALVAVTLFGPVLVVGIVGFLIWGLIGLVPAVVASIAALAIVKTATGVLDRTLSPRPTDDPRLSNLVEGLSSDLGLEPPSTHVVAGEGVNALVFWDGKRPALGLTTEATSSLARTELEALLAHCLVRLDPSEGGLDRSALTLGGVFGACAGGISTADDIRAAAVTRYPPALAKTIERATPATGRFSYLWFVADDPSHAPQAARIAALQDL